MKFQWKRLLAAGIAAGLSAAITVPAFAGNWQKLEGGEYWQWQYIEDDGTFPVSTWKDIEGKLYHFDDEGYLDVGWKFLNGKWYHLGEDGALTTNTVCRGGHIDETGTWVDEKVPPASYWDTTAEDDTYWTAKLMEYGLLDVPFQANADGSYTLSCAYDQFATLPDLYNTVFAKAVYTFNGFSYSWRMSGNVFTFTVTNIGATY